MNSTALQLKIVYVTSFVLTAFISTFEQINECADVSDFPQSKNGLLDPLNEIHVHLVVKGQLFASK